MNSITLHICCGMCRWASTCQTIGMNIGYFTSFTAFLALNDAGFCNKYLRRGDAASERGILSLTAYLRFWGWVYLIVTIGIALFKRETNSAQKGTLPDRSLSHCNALNHEHTRCTSIVSSMGHLDLSHNHGSALRSCSEREVKILRFIPLKYSAEVPCEFEVLYMSCRR